MSAAETACLARLTEMDRALELMQAELPEDALHIGEEARAQVAVWLSRLAAGGTDLGGLSDAMDRIGALMDALTARLLLVPWDGHPPAKGRPS